MSLCDRMRGIKNDKKRKKTIVSKPSIPKVTSTAPNNFRETASMLIIENQVKS